MANTFPFSEIFFEYEPEEPLRAALGQAAVCHAEIAVSYTHLTLPTKA